MEAGSSTPEELLAHAQWLRGLARRMVQDEATADDLVQETWLAAMRHAPRREGVRPWLARVLKNASRQRLRGGERRVQRERQSARDESDVLTPEQLALRLEQERLLLAAVSALRDPYKTVLLLRYEEGLSLVEIARRHGLPAATVRTQVHRALEELRGRMDETAGGHGAWAALLAPGVGVANTGGAIAAMEVIGMSSMTKVGLVGAALLAAIVGVWSVGTQDAQDQPQVAAESRSHAKPPGRQASPLSRESAERVTAREVITESPSAPGPTAARQHLFQARIVDEHGLPIEGASILWIAGEERSTRSGSDGRIELTVDLDDFGDLARVEVEAPEFLPLEIEISPLQGDHSWLGDITLVGGARLSGSVIDPQGQLVAGAKVFLTWARVLDGQFAHARREGPAIGDLWDGAEETLTDAGGQFEFGTFETGTRMLWVTAPECLWTIEGPFEIRAGERRELALALEPAPVELRIAGVVLDPAGRGVPHAHLWFYDDTKRGKRSGTADEEGRFDLLLEVDRAHELRAVDPEERYPEVVVSDVQPGTTDVLLRFVESRRLRIVGTDREGDPLSIESLYATNERDDNIITIGDESADPEQGAQLLEPAEPFLVKLRADGHAEGVFGPFLPGELDERTEFELEAVEQVTGIVYVNGKALPGARIELYASIGTRQLVYNRGFQVTRYPFSFQETSTDEDGRFALTPRESTDFFLRASHEGLAAAEYEVHEYDAREGAEVDFELSLGAAIRGVVLPRPGENATGRMVAASRGDANEYTARVGPDGSFRFDQVMPGRWLVEVLSGDQSDAGATFMQASVMPELDWNLEVQKGEEAFIELDLASQPTSVLEGRLRIDGQGAAGWSAALRPIDRPSGRPAEFPQTSLDAKGHFHLETPLEGEHRLILSAPTTGVELTLRATLELSNGVQEWAAELATGTVEVTNVRNASHEFFHPHLRWTGTGGLKARISLIPDEHGWVRLDSIPAGKYVLADHPDGPRTPAALFGEVALSAGKTLRLAYP